MITNKQPVSMYGIGYAYPIQANVSGRGPVLTSEEDLVKRSIRCILMTRIGERPELVRNGIPFGTMLSDGLFQSEETARDMIPYEAKRALDLWEPRIVVSPHISVSSVETEAGLKVVVRIPFRYRSTGLADTYTQPFTVRRT
jgi:phage baseplate assembly protein W